MPQSNIQVLITWVEASLLRKLSPSPLEVLEVSELLKKIPLRVQPFLLVTSVSIQLKIP